MQNYNERLRTILRTGKKRIDRTGVGTISRFGGEDEYHFFDGFPLYGNRKILLRWIFQELRWMLRGDSNIRWLQEQGVTIWDEWAVTPEMANVMENFNVTMFSHDLIGLKKFDEKDDPAPNPHSCTFEEMRDWLAARSTNIEDYQIVRPGDVGKMYPSLWRNFNGVDQIKATLESIRKFPYSRRHCVSAWDPKHLPIDGLTPEENVFENRGALAACHHFFQFYVEELTLIERMILAAGKQARDVWRLPEHELIGMLNFILGTGDMTKERIGRLLDDLKIPTQGLSIGFHMRSH